MVKKADIKSVVLVDGSIATFVGEPPKDFNFNTTSQAIVEPYLVKANGCSPTRVVNYESQETSGVAIPSSVHEWEVDDHTLTQLTANNGIVVYILTNKDRTFQVEAWYE